MSFLQTTTSTITNEWAIPAKSFYVEKKDLSRFSGLNKVDKNGKPNPNFSTDKKSFPEIVSILERTKGEEVLLKNVQRLFPYSDYRNVEDLEPLSRKFWENVEKRLHSDPLYKFPKEIRNNKDSR